MKKTLWGLGIVVVVLIGAVLIAPSFIDWNQYKDEIAQQARKFTGRELSIGGDIRATVLPAPALIAEDVRLGNIEGASSPEMVSLDRLEVRIALVPLLVGDVRIETVRLIKPTVELEKTADGRTNWTFQPPAEAGGAEQGDEAAPAGGGGAPSVVVQNFRIEDGTLIYRDAAAGTTQRVEDIDADFAAASLQGPFESSGALTFQNTRLGFDANVGEMIQGRTVPLGFRLDFGGGALVASASGTLLGLEEDAPRFKADVKVEGPDAARVVRVLQGADAANGLPGLLAQPFSLQTAVTATVEEVAAGNLVLSLGDVRARGDARVRLAEVPEARIDLMAESIDLDRLLAAAAPTEKKAAGGGGTGSGGSTPPPTPSPDGGQGGGEAGFSLPTGVAGSLSLRVDALKVKGEVVRNAVVNAELAQGELTLSQLSAQLPGATDVAVFGFLSAKDGTPRFEGNVEATANDLRAVLDWVGVSLDTVPSDRLRQLNLAADIRATTEQTSIEKLRLQFDNTTVTGGAVIAHRARPSFGVGLTVDRIDVDAYLKDETAAGDGPTAGDGGATGSGAGGGTAKDDTAANPFGTLNALTSFDANVRLHLKEFVYSGKSGRDLFVEGALHANALDLKRLSVGGYAGVAGQLSGRLVELPSMPTAEAVKLDVSGKSLGGLFGVLGTAPPLPVSALGPTRLQAEVNGNLLQPDLSATLETLGGRFGASGRVNVLPVGQRFDLTLTAKHNDPASLFRTVSKGGYRPTGPLGPLDLTAAAAGNEEKITISALEGAIGKLDVKGTGAVDLTGERPRVTADLTAGELVVDPFLPAERQASLGGGRLIPAVATPSRSGRSGIIRIAAGSDGRWSDDPIDLSGLDAVDADIKLKADAVRYQRYDLRQADVVAKLAAGTLTVEKLVGRLFDGDLTADAKLEAGSGNAVSGTVSLQNALVEQALQAVRGQADAKGRMSASGTFRFNAASTRQIVNSLAGDGKIAMTGVDIEKGVTGSTLTGLFGMVTAMNQLGGVLGKVGVREGAGLADASATFTAENGVIATKDAAVDSNFGKATAAGDVNLPAWKLDLQGQIKLAPNVVAQVFGKALDKEPVPFAITGSLDAPSYKVDTSKLAAGSIPIPGADKLMQKVPEGARGLVEGILGGFGGGGASTQQKTPETTAPAEGSGTQEQPPQQQQKPLSPEDLLKGLLKRR